MKIIFLEAVQDYGGARKSTIEMAYRLTIAGNQVLIVDFWGCCKPFITEIENRGLPYRIINHREDPIILANPSKVKYLKNQIFYIFTMMSYRKKLDEIIEDFQADFIIVNNVKTLSVLRKSKAYRIIYFARGWFLPATISKIDRWFLKKLTDIFIGVSQATRQAIFAGNFANLDNIFVIPNALDRTPIQNIMKNSKVISWDKCENNRPFVMLHCGGFLKSKGQDVMLRIANEMRELNINFKVLLLGIIYTGYESAEYYKAILKEIDSLNLQNHFEIVLNAKNVHKYFSECDLLVHPSSTEGLPRVVMEAMAFGKPVVGNAVGGMTDYILDGFTGFLPQHNDISDYVDKISLLIRNKQLYSFISKNAASLIENSYSQDKQIKVLKQIFNQNYGSRK